MSELQEKMRIIGREAQRYLQVAHLTPSLPLLLPLAPMFGALLLASAGLPGAAATFGLLLATLCLWGIAWTFNDLSNARRQERAGSLILRGVVTRREALWLLAALCVVLLLVAGWMGGRFALFAALALLAALTFPWLRRHTYLIEAWFGLGIACTVPMAYAASGRWPDKVGALLGVVTLLWAMGWLVLKQWPRHLELMGRGARTLGLMFGDATGHLVSALQAAALFGAWMAGAQAKLGAFYSVALLFSAGLIIWQWRLLHRQRQAGNDFVLRLHLISGVVIWLGVQLHFASAG